MPATGAPEGNVHRYTAASPCPVCGGSQNLPRGRSLRCAGFSLDVVCYCTREEYAGLLTTLADTDPPAYKHLRFGRCDCGREHAPARAYPELFGRGGDTHDAKIVRAPRRESLPLAERYGIFAFLLDHLALRDGARFDLRRRGLTPDAIAEVGYRSLPPTKAARKVLLATMVAQFGAEQLRRCPGFTDKNGRLSFPWGEDYLVPYRDEQRQITGFQIKVLGGKYVSLRGSVHTEIYHIGGHPQAGGDLTVIEGGLKSEAASRLGGIATLGVIGLRLTDEHLEAIGRLAVGRVIVAVDQEANPATIAARSTWAKRLHRAGFRVTLAVWEGADANGPKGLDDLFQAGKRPRLRAFTTVPPELGTRRIPREVPEPGPLPPGTTLTDAREATTRRIDRFVKDRWGSRGQALLIQAGSGVGKSTAVARALSPKASARLVTGTLALAQEQAAASGYHLVVGRSPANCERFDVVRALEEHGHPIAKLACGTPEEPHCPHRTGCAYWAQFAQPGPLVGAAEQAFNPTFVRHATLIVYDDAELLRAMIEEHVVTPPMLARAVELLTPTRRKAAHRLLALLQHALIDPPAPVLIGPAVWDHLAHVAGQHGLDLLQLIDALPKKAQPLPPPGPDADGYVSVRTVEEVPAGTLLRLLRTLREERDGFASGSDFNSRLKLTGGPVPSLTVSRVRDQPRDDDGWVLTQNAALLILDATPVYSLVDHLTRHHRRLPDFTANVRLPENVRVVQHAGAGNGHAALKPEGSLTGIFAEIAAARREFPVAEPGKEAAIVYQRQQRAFVAEVGFREDRVLTYGSARGTNTLAHVERLHVVGRPMPPIHELSYLAQVIHHDGGAVSDQLALASRPYTGQRYVIDVLDFVDPRPAELLRARRDDELLQVAHRARLATLEPQLQLEPEARRTQLTLVIHTSHALPGLRVDDLRFGAHRTSVNEERHAGAERRIQAAVRTLSEEGEAVTVAAVARVAGVSRNTVSQHFGEGAYTLIDRSSKGVRTLPISDSPLAETDASHPPDLPADPAMSPRRVVARDRSQHRGPPPADDLAAIIRASITDPFPGPDAWVPCRAGCGALVHPGQKCRACAADAVAAWVAAAKPRRLPSRSPHGAHERDTGDLRGDSDSVANPRDGP
jgi:hypothetical protein